MLVVNGLFDTLSLRRVALLEMSRATDAQESLLAIVELALSSVSAGHLIARIMSALKACGPRWLSATSSLVMELIGKSQRLKEGFRDRLMANDVILSPIASSLIPLYTRPCKSCGHVHTLPAGRDTKQVIDTAAQT
jgi:hypothetical protein